ncbi:MAG: hypothetical protein R3C09_19810 [Pirellulaceae bacterium]
MKPSEPPRIDSREIESFAIRVGELRQFVRELPDREVAVRFPYTNSTLPMQTVIDSFNRYGDDDYIFDQSQWHVISQAEINGGWLRLTFGWRYWLYYHLKGAELRHLLGPEMCTNLDDIIGLAYASYQTGLTLESLRQVMPGLHFCADRLRRLTGPDFESERLITDPIALLSSAIEIWKNDPGYVNTRFMGGGFGLQGAIEGIVIANALNRFIDKRNRVVEASHMQRLQQPLEFGFQQLRATQELVRM